MSEHPRFPAGLATVSDAVAPAGALDYAALNIYRVCIASLSAYCVDAGNGRATPYADQRQAYGLMDRATYLTLKTEVTLQVLVEKDPDLLNYIAVIRMNSVKFPQANVTGAQAFVAWLVSEEAPRLIEAFEKDRYGASLFFPNSAEWRQRHPR